MARNKKDDSSNNEHMRIAEELRSKIVVVKKEKKVDNRQAFHKFFIKVRDKLKLKPSMESVLWKHLVATGNDKVENFKKGISDFGYDI